MSKPVEFYGHEVTLQPEWRFAIESDRHNNDWHYEIKCLSCNEWFYSDRRHSKTCSNNCRVQFSRERRFGKPSIDLHGITKLMTKHLPTECIQQMREAIKEEVEATRIIKNADDLRQLKHNLAMLDFLK